MKENPIYKNKFTLPAVIEALLFVSSVPISINQLSQALDQTKKSVTAAIAELEEKYQQTSGLRIQRKGTF